MEIIIYYVLPIIGTLGSLYAVGKAIEYFTWSFIKNYDPD